MLKLSRIEWAVIALTILGALLRFWNIGFQWMNYDEQFTVEFARPALSVIEIFFNSLSHDYTPPFYYIAAHFSMIFFGENATAIRIPSAIFGIAFIPIMYFIGKEYKDELFGLLTAGYATIYYNAIFYSKFGRSYAMDFVFFSVAFYFFMKVLKGDKYSGTFFAVFALCSIWTHLYSAIPIGAMCLYLIWKRCIPFLGFLILTLGSLPLLSYITVILKTRCVVGVACEFTGIHSFGATPFEILTLMPLDIFAYSAFLIVPIVVWSLWVRRSDPLFQIITFISLVTWGSMFILSEFTPIILHYAVFLVPILMLPFVAPFYDAIKKDVIYFHHLVVIMIIMILEAVQIAALAVVQRAWHF